jgi:hypothetical protein
MGAEEAPPVEWAESSGDKGEPAGPAAAEAEMGGRYITLGRWGALPAAERRRALSPAPSEDRFTAQGDSESIGWARWSWNPLTGCEHNCPYCYARDMARRIYRSSSSPPCGRRD